MPESLPESLPNSLLESLNDQQPHERDGRASGRPNSGGAKSVVILGAGLAGLTAADELVQAGYEVTVLEGQLRPGGRVRTLREPFADGLHAEIGASRILDCHHRVLAYARALGLKLIPFFPAEGDAIDYVRGSAVRVSRTRAPQLSAYPLALKSAEQRLSVAEAGKAVFGPLLGPGGEPRELAWPLGPLRALDQLGLEDLLRSLGFSVALAEALALGFREQDGLDISLLYVLRQFALEHEHRQVLKIAGGNDRLPCALAARLAAQISYGCQVVAIESGREQVRVRYRQSGVLRTASAERAVCTLPLPALRDIEVTPALSPEKMQAVQQVRYCAAARVVLQVRRRSWQAQGLSGFARTDLPGEIWDPSYEQPGPRGMLQAYFRLGAAEKIGALDREARLAFAVAHLEQVLPGLQAQVEGGECFCWHHDPWSRGAVAVPLRGQATLLPATAQAEGRVHFAGEHTSPWAGWMEGAIDSGQRAAGEILRAGS